MEKINLSEATELHQEVGGTDPSSVYRVIAIGKQINAAARMKELSGPDKYRISIRVEVNALYGAAIPESLYEPMSKIGLSKASDSHWSCHVTGEPLYIRMLLGAVLFGLAEHWDEMIGAEVVMKPEQEA